MAEIDTPTKMDDRRIPFLVMAFSIAVPLTIVSGVFLGVTGYPVEEWPFVSGVFVATLLMSGTLMVWLLIFLGKKLNSYGRLVLAERGIDVDSTVAETAVPTAFAVAASIVLVSLLIAVIWGPALKALVFVLDQMSMPSLGASLTLAADVMSLVGVCGLALAYSFQFLLYYSVRRMERQWIIVFTVARFLVSVARTRDRSTLLWRTVGFSV